ELGVGGGIGWGSVWDANAKSMPVEASPESLFARLFPGGALPTEERTEPTDAMRVAAAQSSVLDFVREDYERRNKRLSKEDEEKPALHRDLVRDLEKRVSGLANAKCDRPPLPDAAPPRGEPGWYASAWKAFVPLVTAALACDLTRVVTLQMT